MRSQTDLERPGVVSVLPCYFKRAIIRTAGNQHAARRRANEAKIYFQSSFPRFAINAGHVPLSTLSPTDDHILSGIAIDEFRFIPRNGDIRQDFPDFARDLCHSFGDFREVLNTGEEND